MPDAAHQNCHPTIRNDALGELGKAGTPAPWITKTSEGEERPKLPTVPDDAKRRPPKETSHPWRRSQAEPPATRNRPPPPPDAQGEVWRVRSTSALDRHPWVPPVARPHQPPREPPPNGRLRTPNHPTMPSGSSSNLKLPTMPSKAKQQPPFETATVPADAKQQRYRIRRRPPSVGMRW